MLQGKRIGVVVPAYNEGKLIGHVIETMPDYVDWIIVVDDASQDDTSDVVHSYVPRVGGRLLLIRHEANQGVGGAIATGYKWCRDHQVDVTVVMAGDAQMDPADLPALLDPVVTGRVDYAKGNRLSSGEAWHKIPRVRYLGNAGLSLLTKIASGYWHVADSQSGYAATNLKVLQTLDLHGIHKRYGVPNDLLVKLNVYNFRVCDVQIEPVYGVGEESGIQPIRMIPRLTWLIIRLFVWRMVQKYVIRDFHPLVFFYGLSFVLLAASVPLALRVFYKWLILGGSIPRINALALMSSVIAGLQTLFFAMWFDMDYNKNLKAQ